MPLLPSAPQVSALDALDRADPSYFDPRNPRGCAGFSRSMELPEAPLAQHPVKVLATLGETHEALRRGRRCGAAAAVAKACAGIPGEAPAPVALSLRLLLQYLGAMIPPEPPSAETCAIALSSLGAAGEALQKRLGGAEERRRREKNFSSSAGGGGTGGRSSAGGSRAYGNYEADYAGMPPEGDTVFWHNDAVMAGVRLIADSAAALKDSRHRPRDAASEAALAAGAAAAVDGISAALPAVLDPAKRVPSLFGGILAEARRKMATGVYVAEEERFAGEEERVRHEERTGLLRFTAEHALALLGAIAPAAAPRAVWRGWALADDFHAVRRYYEAEEESVASGEVEREYGETAERLLRAQDAAEAERRQREARRMRREEEVQRSGGAGGGAAAPAPAQQQPPVAGAAAHAARRAAALAPPQQQQRRQGPAAQPPRRAKAPLSEAEMAAAAARAEAAAAALIAEEEAEAAAAAAAKKGSSSGDATARAAAKKAAKNRKKKERKSARKQQQQVSDAAPHAAQSEDGGAALARASAAAPGVGAAAAALDDEDDEFDERDEECVVCLCAQRTHQLLPCGHFCACGACVELLKESLLASSSSGRRGGAGGGQAAGGAIAVCPLCRAVVEAAEPVERGEKVGGWRAG